MDDTDANMLLLRLETLEQATACNLHDVTWKQF